MSKNKQNSIDSFVKKLKKQGLLITEDSEFIVAYLEAKAMHKEEIVKAFDEGQECEYQVHINSAPRFDSETYYNETFGGNNEN